MHQSHLRAFEEADMNALEDLQVTIEEGAAVLALGPWTTLRLLGTTVLGAEDSASVSLNPAEIQ
jgi:hypothetical protein